MEDFVPGVEVSLEEIILRHALGGPIASLERERPAVGPGLPEFITALATR